MNRSAYCIQMLKLLQARGTMSKTDLAKELGVNVRNIQEYRKELEIAGYDISVKQGKLGGYTLEKGALLPMCSFSDQEEKALQEAMTYLKVHADFYLYDDYVSAMDKVFGSHDIHAQESIYLNDAMYEISKKEKDMIRSCEWARKHQYAIDLEYKSMYAKSFSKIRIHPYEILNYKGSYYCMAYSLSAKDFRNFKFSEERMRNVVISHTQFTRDQTFELKEHVGNLGLIQDEVYELELILKKETALLMSEKRVGWNPKWEWIDEETLRYQTTMEGNMQVISFLLSLGHQCMVVKPFILKEEIQKILQEMTGNYQNTV